MRISCFSVIVFYNQDDIFMSFVRLLIFFTVNYYCDSIQYLSMAIHSGVFLIYCDHFLLLLGGG